MANPTDVKDGTSTENPKLNGLENTDPGRKDVGKALTDARISSLETSLKNTKRAFWLALGLGAASVTAIIEKDEITGAALSRLDAAMDNIKSGEDAQIQSLKQNNELVLSAVKADTDKEKEEATKKAKEELELFTSTFEFNKGQMIEEHSDRELEIKAKESAQVEENLLAKQKAMEEAIKEIEAEYAAKEQKIHVTADDKFRANDVRLNDRLIALQSAPEKIAAKEQDVHEQQNAIVADLVTSQLQEEQVKLEEIGSQKPFAKKANAMFSNVLGSVSGWVPFEGPQTIDELIDCKDGSDAVVVVDCLDGQSIDSNNKNIYVCKGEEVPVVNGTNTIRVPGYKKVEADEICDSVDGVWATKLRKAN